MNTTTHTPSLGLWLAVIEHRTHDALRTAHAEQGVTRREGRLLSIIENGPVTIEEIMAARPSRGGPRRDRAERSEQRPERPERFARPDALPRESTADVVERLVQHGWVASDDRGRLTITPDGERAKSGLRDRIGAVRAEARTGITDADYATTLATLEAMARNLGWSEDAPRPERRHRRRGGMPDTRRA